MTTVSYENLDLRIMQQSNEIKDFGTLNMRGALNVNVDDGVATFVEDRKAKACGKNPIFWEGEHMKMRITKDGKLRLTACLDVPADIDNCDVLVEALEDDFVGAYNKIYDLSNAKRRPSPRSPYRNRVARGRVITTEIVA